MLVDKSESIQCYPEIAKEYYPSYSVYVMFLEKSGKIRGTLVDFKSRKLVELWYSKLGLISEQEKIIHAVAKPINRKYQIVYF